MADSPTVFHEGHVVGISGRKVQVKITSRSACAGCHARGVCTAADMEEKIIDALYVSDEPVQIGDSVTVIMEEKMGQKAVIYGFFFPLIVLVTVLFLARALGSSEVTAALLGIGSLVPYYLVLYAFRKKIEKSFIFTAEKKNKF